MNYYALKQRCTSMLILSCTLAPGNPGRDKVQEQATSCIAVAGDDATVERGC
jgi:hypothetical protein